MATQCAPCSHLHSAHRFYIVCLLSQWCVSHRLPCLLQTPTHSHDTVQQCYSMIHFGWFCGFHGQQRKQISGFLTKLSREGTVRHCQSKETSIVWSHHEETRELPGERDNARNNARCMQARKTTHGLDGQHQDVDRTPRGRVNQNDRGKK